MQNRKRDSKIYLCCQFTKGRISHQNVIFGSKILLLQELRRNMQSLHSDSLCMFLIQRTKKRDQCVSRTTVLPLKLYLPCLQQPVLFMDNMLSTTTRDLVALTILIIMVIMLQTIYVRLKYMVSVPSFFNDCICFFYGFSIMRHLYWNGLLRYVKHLCFLILDEKREHYRSH